jgi:hypothetical protein
MAKKSLGIGIGVAAVIIIIAIVAFFMLGSIGKIADIKNEAHVGQTVTVRGVVQTTIKLGDLSGYTLKDDTDTIAVSSEQLPKEGATITVTGTLMRDTLFGYYIKVS